MPSLFHQAAIVFFVALMLLSAGRPADADGTRAPTCATPTKPVSINIKNPTGRVVYNTGVSRNDLIRIRQSRSGGVMQSNWRPLGLTLSNFQFQIGTSVNLTPIADNKYCVYPASFDITVGYSGFKVYIDRRYGKGSCEYRAVLEHENTHVSLYRSSLLRSQPELQRAVYSAARGIKPIVVTSPDQGAKYVQKLMEKTLNPLVARMNRNAENANARIDTVTNYKRVQVRCRNW